MNGSDGSSGSLTENFGIDGKKLELEMDILEGCDVSDSGPIFF